MNDFQETYNQVFKDLAGVHGTMESEIYCNNIDLKIFDAVKALEDEAMRLQNVSVHYQKGWLAEQWHAETFKIDSAVKGNKNVWATVPGKNRPGEDIIYGGDNTYKTAELKYYRNGIETSKVISNPTYINKEKIVPSDQIDLVRKSAQWQADKLDSYRPKQAKNYQDTADRANDRIRFENVSSKPLSESKAKAIAEDYKKNKKIDLNKNELNSENFVEWSDIAKQSGKAAMHAALLTAAIQMAPHIYNLLNEIIENGEVDFKNLEKSGLSVMKGSSISAFRGGVAASITASFRTGLFGSFLKKISPAAIGMATTMVLNTIDYSLKLYKGEIANHQFSNLCIKDSMILTSALAGAAVGQLIIPIPMLGALIGNIVGGILGNFLYDGSNTIMLGLGIDNGWTFLGLVQQEYTVSEKVLRTVGYDIFESNAFLPESFEMNKFDFDHFAANEFLINSFHDQSINFTPLKRGIIGVNVVGYI